MFKRLLLSTALAAGFVGALAVTAPKADAAVILMVGNTTITDGGAGDLNPNANQITYVGSGTTFAASINTGVFTTIPYLDLASSEISSIQAGSLTIKLTATGVTSPATIASFISKLSGNITGSTLGIAGASVELKTYYDATNTAFGTATQLSDLTGTGATFATLASANAGGTTPFSITEVLTVTATAAGQNFSLDGSLTAVPEPISIALLGTGLVGAGVLRLKRRGA